MSGNGSLCTCNPLAMPAILPVRKQSEVILDNLRDRVATVLPGAMREAGLDMWIILCQEDDLEPTYQTMIPMDTWCPILQMLVFVDKGDEGVEGINIGGTDTADLYARPYMGQLPERQWPLLTELVKERDPKRIGINIGSIEWAAGGLTHNLYNQLVAALPEGYAERLVSAEPAATRWLANLTDKELELYEHIVTVGRALIAECYSSKAITPGATTIDDVKWYYWQRASDLGVSLAFKPYFSIVRPLEGRQRYGENDRVIRPGDCIHCDVGIKYLRMNTDHQQWAYVLKPGETDAPAELRALMAEANRLQDVWMAEMKHGLTGNQILANILNRARAEGIPDPRVYSHSLGYYLHEPGPLIGLPWEQECCVGRGDVKLDYGNTFTAELAVTGEVAGWPDGRFRMSIEEDIAFTRDGAHPVSGRQTAFYLV